MVTNQASHVDTQNADIDIEAMYQDFIKEIDGIRSAAVLSADQSIFSNLKDKSITSLPGKTKIEASPQESRCHAFFRLIGFPCMDKNQSDIYNPGFASQLDSSFMKPLEDKKSVLLNQDLLFQKLSFAREQYSKQLQYLFRGGIDIDGICFVLSTVNTRSFTVYGKEGLASALDFSEDAQSYSPSYDVVNSSVKSLLDFQDGQGNKPTKLSSITRKHIITPFLVDSRIELTTTPNSRLVAVPFIPNKQKLLISENTFAKRPLIEKVIRDRFSSNQNFIGTNLNDAQAFIDSLYSITDKELIKKIETKDLYGLGEQSQFLNFFNIITSMVRKLVEAQRYIQNIQSKYYWLPSIKPSGPEDPCGVQPIPFSATLALSGMLSTKDQEILKLQLKVKLNRVTTELQSVLDQPDIGGFALGSFQTVFDMKPSESLGDVTGKSLEFMMNRRDKELLRGSACLRTIEIIMGECSGLGLCDIICVMGALYLMPKEDLLGFLDKPAQERCKSSLGLTDVELGISSSTNIVSSLQSMTESYQTYTKLMDNIYDNVMNNNL
jgi:hypothetical protein